MKVTVADLFAAYCRANEEYASLRALSEADLREEREELSKLILIMSWALEDCRHEVKLSLEDYRAVEQFFSKAV